MPYIVNTAIYPNEIGNQVAEKYFEVIKKYPPDQNLVVEVVPAAVKTTHEGIKVIHIEEVKEGKLEEALKRNGEIQMMFSSVQGYRNISEIYLKVEEAMALIGMSGPK